MDRTSQLGEKSIPNLMWQFSLPSIVAMLVQSSYNIINMSFIGRSVGAVGIAAIAVSVPVTMIQGAISQMIGSGCSARVSILAGEADYDGARRTLGCSMKFAILFSLSLMVVAQLFLDPLLAAFGASETILPYSHDYMRVMLLGMVFSNFVSMNPMLRIEGFPMRAMATQLISTAINLVLSPTFIFVFDLGIQGAALSSVVAQLATAVWIFLFLINKKRTIGLKREYFKFDLKIISNVLPLGLPGFLMQLAQSMLSITMNKNLGTYGGDTAISAWGIMTSITTLISQPVFGMNQGAQPIIGYNMGAKKYKRVRQTIAWTLGIATAFSVLAWALTRLFPVPMFAFFNKDPELIELGTGMMKIFMACLFLVGFQQSGAAYFQSAGKPRISIVLTLSRQVLILIPSVWILSYFFQLQGLLVSGIISDIASALITGIFILREAGNLKKLETLEAQ